MFQRPVKATLPLVLLTFLTSLLVAAEPTASEKQRPNIILIIADDLGPEDSGPYGCKGVRTPNLDQMAKDGMKFTSAFNTCSSCSPAGQASSPVAIHTAPERNASTCRSRKSR